MVTLREGQSGTLTAANTIVSNSPVSAPGSGTYFQHLIDRTVTLGGQSSQSASVAEQWGKQAVIRGTSSEITARIYHSDSDTEAPRRISRVIHPDGSLTTWDFDWSSGLRTITVERGEPNGSYTEVQKGERVVSLTTYCGRMLDEIVEGFDVPAESVLLTSRHVLPTDFDDLGRATKVHYNLFYDADTLAASNTDFEEYAYDCCGVSQHIDRYGRIRTYGYDDLGRVVLTYVKRSDNGAAAVAFETIYDGLTTSFERAGTETARRIRNLAGDLVESWSADEDTGIDEQSVTYLERTFYTTTYSSAGRLVETTTPVEGTIYRSYHPDGRLHLQWGTAVPDKHWEFRVENTGELVEREYRYSSAMTDPPTDPDEWIETWTDEDGRTVYRKFAHTTAVQEYEYYANGKLFRVTDPDGVKVEYTYHDDGSNYQTIEYLSDSQTRVRRREYSYADVDFDPDPMAADTRGARVEDHYLEDASSSPTDSYHLDTVSSSGDGYVALTDANDRISRTIRSLADRDDGEWSVEDHRPDGTYTERVYSDGLLTDVKEWDDGGASVIASTSYTYGPLGRVLTVTDSRTGTLTYDYDPPTGDPDGVPEVTESGNVLYMEDAAGVESSFVYDDGGRLIIAYHESEDDWAAYTTTHYSYYPTGQLQSEWGDLTYARWYEYDEQGRMTSLRTWRTLPSGFATATGSDPLTSPPAGADLTTWSYDSEQGTLVEKTYADDSSVTYGYTDAGRLATRT